MSRVVSSLISITIFHRPKTKHLSQECVKQWTIKSQVYLKCSRYYKGNKCSRKKNMRSLSLSSLLLQCTNAYTLWQVTETPRIVSLYPPCARYRMNTLGAVVIFSAKA